MSRTKPGSRVHTGFKLSAALALVLQSVFAHADLIKVSTDTDAIPAPLGSLRMAIERAESTLAADQIVFDDAISLISLVAPLPEIAQGRVAIGRPAPFNPTQREVDATVTISGSGSVSHALQVTGPNVGLHRLGFEGFVGPAAVEFFVEPTSIEISGCRFGGVPLGNTFTGLSIRIGPDTGVNHPIEIDVRHSHFYSNARGLEVKIAVSTFAIHQDLNVRNNRFGLPQFFGGSLSNGTAISLSSGPWNVVGNVVTGTGAGFELTSTDGANVARNQFGLLNGVSSQCDSPDQGLVTLRSSPRAVIESNHVGCSLGDGLRVLNSSNGVLVRDNLISRSPFEPASIGPGIVVEDSLDVTVRGNLVRSEDVAVVVRGAAERTIVSCNALFGAIAPLQVIPPAASPPAVTAASPLSARIDVADPEIGWVELFVGQTANGIRFYGAQPTGPDDAEIAAPLEVLDLDVKKAGNTASISWDESLDPVVTATRWRPGVNSSETGLAIAMNDTSYVFDLIRGSVELLARANDGSVDLGPVDCLADDRIPGMSLLVTDPDLPAPGSAFFYVARRDTPLSVRAGSYDPAVCGLDLRSFQGPRRARVGDCGH